MVAHLDIDAILRQTPVSGGEVIGTSRGGRQIHGERIGTGRRIVSLIAGCHADEPVGPAMLARLTAWLRDRPAEHPALRTFTWHLVPHTNPDGAAINAVWSDRIVDDGYGLVDYLENVVREAPGDDIEFGFPRADEPLESPSTGHYEPGGLRPENRAVASFLRHAAPIDLHASFHGMAFAAGPWFLLEPTWIDRTADMRDAIRTAVRARGYRLHDIDRKGEKGFSRIDRGFTTRPNAQAMADHFRRRGDHEMASRFRPSSMDYVRGLGGDPLTLVSEMPLFITPPEIYEDDPVRPRALARLTSARAEQDTDRRRRATRDVANAIGIRPMPIEDQMRLQLIYLSQALESIRRLQKEPILD